MWIILGPLGSPTLAQVKLILLDVDLLRHSSGVEHRLVGVQLVAPLDHLSLQILRQTVNPVIFEQLLFALLQVRQSFHLPSNELVTLLLFAQLLLFNRSDDEFTLPSHLLLKLQGRAAFERCQ